MIAQTSHRLAWQKTGWIAVLAVCQALAACSWLIDVDRVQCERSKDCAAAGLPGTCEQGVCVEIATPAADAGMADSGKEPEGDEDSCLGSMTCDDGKVCFKDTCVVERDVQRFLCDKHETVETKLVHFEMPVREFISAMPPKGMVVNACRGTDVSCTSPDATFIDETGAGDIALDLPYRFDGYLEVRSEDALTALWYFTKPLLEPQVAKPLAVVSPPSLQLLASITRLNVDESKGVVILEAFDCERLAVGGVHFEEGKKMEMATPFYIIDGRPNVESGATARDDANNQAVGGFLNATPGFTVFSARIGLEGTLLGTYNANVRANTVTYLDIHP